MSPPPGEVRAAPPRHSGTVDGDNRAVTHRPRVDAVDPPRIGPQATVTGAPENMPLPVTGAVRLELNGPVQPGCVPSSRQELLGWAPVGGAR
jgi:hypothetical protein